MTTENDAIFRQGRQLVAPFNTIQRGHAIGEIAGRTELDTHLIIVMMINIAVVGEG